VTIILGGDSLFHKTKTPTSIPATRKGRRDVELSRGYDTDINQNGVEKYVGKSQISPK
jgi:hypothetical protein